ncbi:MAG: DHA2 family efflux MFS transporter permease subunit [Deltaproteobacteria bacterium]|nr:DHA2 family efflux MFS transporter permease subunit [Deltaproteobacteria bacterium]
MRPACDETFLRAVPAVSCEPAQRSWVLAATILGSSLAFIDGTVVNVALPALQSTFHADVVDLQWVVESYGLLLSALILVGGSLGDRLGLRIVFVVGVGCFAIASAACGLAGSIAQLIVSRSVQGVGAALLVPGSLALITATFDEKQRGKAIGTWSGATAMTTAAGPVLGGWLVEHASWRWAFFINVPIAAAVIAISLLKIPETRNHASGSLDLLGATLVTLGLGGVVYGFIESTNLGWSHPLVVGTIVLGAIALGAFVIVERRARSPMVPPKLFASRDFSGANAMTLFLYAAIAVFFFFFPMNLIQAQGYTASRAGAALLPLILLVFVLSRWSGGLVTRYGARRPLILGPLVVAVGFLMFARTGIGQSYWTHFLPAILVLGMGLALAVAPLTTVVMGSVPRELVGTASGINNAVSRVAGVLAIAIFGVVMVGTFGARMNSRIESVPMSTEQRRALQSEETKLAGLQAPSGLDSATARAVRESVQASFVDGFRVVMLICAGLAATSAGIIARMIGRAR